MSANSLLDIMHRHLDSYHLKVVEAKGQQQLLNKMRDAHKNRGASTSYNASQAERRFSLDLIEQELEACLQTVAEAEIAETALRKILDEFSNQTGVDLGKSARVRRVRLTRHPTDDVRLALDTICSEGGEWTFGDILDRVKAETGRTVSGSTVRSIIKKDSRFEDLGGGRYRIR